MWVVPAKIFPEWQSMEFCLHSLSFWASSAGRCVAITGVPAVRYRDEILAPVAIPYLQNLGPNAILQDDNARPHRARIITEYLQNEGVERMEWPAVSPDLNPI